MGGAELRQQVFGTPQSSYQSLVKAVGGETFGDDRGGGSRRSRPALRNNRSGPWLARRASQGANDQRGAKLTNRPSRPWTGVLSSLRSQRRNGMVVSFPTCLMGGRRPASSSGRAPARSIRAWPLWGARSEEGDRRWGREGQSGISGNRCDQAGRPSRSGARGRPAADPAGASAPIPDADHR